MRMERSDISEIETIELDLERGRIYLISKLGHWGNNDSIVRNT